MILAFAFAVAATQAVAPTLPAAVRPEFAQAVRAVEQALENGKFEDAAHLATLLPNRSITVSCNASGVPASLRQDFSDAVGASVTAWSQFTNVTLRLGQAGDIQVSFAGLLPKGPSGMPAASELKFGDTPRINLIIGMKRGIPAENIMAADVFAQVGRAIGAYLGLADNPLASGIMHPDDNPGARVSKPAYNELKIAALNLKAVDELRSDIEKKVILRTVDPVATLTPAFIDLGSVRQGTKVPLDFKLVNKGSGSLDYKLQPDCGCFTGIPAGKLDSGASTTLETVVDTAEYVGTVHKMLVLYSNDATHPTIEVPISFHAVPAFRLFRPEGPNVLVGDKPVDVTILLTLPKGSALDPEQYQLEGLESAKVTMKPWQGMAADPELNEGPKPREGYKFSVHIPGKLPLGRMAITLSVKTDDAIYSMIRYTLTAQKGIVASPDNVQFGDMVVARRQSFTVSRPGKPFKITKIDTGNPHIKATIVPLEAFTDYRIDIQYDGQGEQGDFRTSIRIHTSDPGQPVVEVALSGIVR